MKKVVDFDKLFTKTIDLLENQKVSYLIIGGLAAGIIGEARMTHDVDVLVKIKKEDMQKFLKAAIVRGFKFNTKKTMETVELQGFFRFEIWGLHADFVIGSMPFELEAFKRGRKIKLYNRQAFFPTPEDLILFKIIPGREKDMLDAKTIVMRHKDKLDIDYLKKWAQVISDDLESVGIYKRLEEVLKAGKRIG